MPTHPTFNEEQILWNKGYEYVIGKATMIAFRKAIRSIMREVLSTNKDGSFFILMDGFKINYLKKVEQKAIVKGDAKCYSIAAASIIAKVTRDQLMRNISEKFPEFNFSHHKGYGTKQHQIAIQKYGLSKIHRTSFNLSFLTPARTLDKPLHLYDY